MSRSALFSADLFADLEAPGPIRETMGEGAVLLRGKALAFEDDLIAALAAITARAPFRRMVTPGGFVMSVAMTNCGAAGWVTDRRGYRYDGMDPETGQPWPDMPACFERLAAEATAEAGYPDFAPDACLVNRYEPGARLSLHQRRVVLKHSASNGRNSGVAGTSHKPPNLAPELSKETFHGESVSSGRARPSRPIPEPLKTGSAVSASTIPPSAAPLPTSPLECPSRAVGASSGRAQAG